MLGSERSDLAYRTVVLCTSLYSTQLDCVVVVGLSSKYSIMRIYIRRLHCFEIECVVST